MMTLVDDELDLTECLKVLWQLRRTVGDCVDDVLKVIDYSVEDVYYYDDVQHYLDWALGYLRNAFDALDQVITTLTDKKGGEL